MYVVCDGYKDFLREPASPEIYNERFYPWYTLMFNEASNEKEMFPPSDVRLMRDMQLEYNRCREGLKEQRIAARPFTAVVAGSMDEEDLDKLDRPRGQRHHRTQCAAAKPGHQAAAAGLRRRPASIPICTRSTPSTRTSCAPPASKRPTWAAPRTPPRRRAQIAEGSRMTSMGSNIDDLNDLLTQLARNGGQILLREMSQADGQEDRRRRLRVAGDVAPGHRQ